MGRGLAGRIRVFAGGQGRPRFPAPADLARRSPSTGFALGEVLQHASIAVGRRRPSARGVGRGVAGGVAGVQPAPSNSPNEIPAQSTQALASPSSHVPASRPPDTVTCGECPLNSKAMDVCSATSEKGSILHCGCNAGYYSSFSTPVPCSPCKSCSPDASTSGACIEGSVKDTVVCTCNTGFTGNGIDCSPSMVPPSKASCRPGFYGDGSQCSACKSCSQYAETQNECAEGSTVDTAVCTCMAGFFGDGEHCSPCSTCPPNSKIMNECGAGSTSNTVLCRCNAGFYGSSSPLTPCIACKTCSPDATMSHP